MVHAMASGHLLRRAPDAPGTRRHLQATIAWRACSAWRGIMSQVTLSVSALRNRLERVLDEGPGVRVDAASVQWRGAHSNAEPAPCLCSRVATAGMPPDHPESSRSRMQ